MLQPKKPLDLSGANKILEERKPLDLSGAESILKKKESSRSTIPMESLGSEPQNGSLVGKKEKSNNSGFPEIDTNSVAPGNGLQPIAPIKEKKYEEGTMAWNHRKMIENNPEYVNNYTKLKDIQKVDDTKKKEIIKSTEEEFNGTGIWNNLKSFGKKAINAVSEPTVAGLSSIGSMFSSGDSDEFVKNAVQKSKIELDPFSEEKQQAKNEYKEAVKTANLNKTPVPKYNPEEINKRALQIKIDNRLKSESDTQLKDYLKKDEETGSKDKTKFITFEAGKYATLQDKDKTLLDKQNIERNVALGLKGELEDLQKDISTKGLNESNRAEYLDKYQKYQDVVSEAIKTHEEYVDNRKDLGDSSENLDVFKRDYGSLKSFLGNVDATVSDLSAGGLGAIDYTLEATKNITNMNPKGQGIIRGAAEDLKSDSDKIRSEIMKPIPVDNINNWSDFGDWFFQTAVAQQVPIYGLLATGNVGVGAIGATSLGNKFEDMQAKMKSGEEKYSTAELILNPIGYGVAETASAMVDVMLLKNAGRVIASASQLERQMIAQGFAKRVLEATKKVSGNVAKGAVYEGLDEGLTQGFENLIDGKPFLDNIKDPIVAGAVMGAVIPLGGHIIAQATKPFSTDSQVQNSATEITRLRQELNNPELSDIAREAIQENLSKQESKLKGSVMKIIGNVEGLSKQQFEEIIRGETTMANIKEKAIDIRTDDTIDDGMKNQLLGNLREEFYATNQRRLELLSKTKNDYNSITDKEKALLREQALEEINPYNEENVNISEQEIEKKSKDIYNRYKNLDKVSSVVTEHKDIDGNDIFETAIKSEDGETLGSISVINKGGIFEVAFSEVHSDAYKGKGIGYLTYKAMINEAKKRGIDVYSDSDSLSSEAENVWDRLVKDGLATKIKDIKGNPEYTSRKSFPQFKTINKKSDTTSDLNNTSNVPEIDIKVEKGGVFSGDFLNEYDFLAQGSEHTVYKSKDGKTVIKIGEPHSSDETYSQRVNDALEINNLLGDGSLSVIGNYRSPNGTINPIYQQNFIEGETASNEQVSEGLIDKGFIKVDNNTFVVNDNGVIKEVSDISDNFIINKKGNIVAVDASIREVPLSSLSKEVKEKLTNKNSNEADPKTNTTEVKPEAKVQESENKNENNNKGILNNNKFVLNNGEEYDIKIFDGINGEVPSFNDRKNKDRLSFSVHNSEGESIANITFWKDKDGKFYSNNTNVKEGYRRKGIATAVYNYAESLGIDIKPSHIQTKMGESFFNTREQRKTDANYNPEDIIKEEKFDYKTGESKVVLEDKPRKNETTQDSNTTSDGDNGTGTKPVDEVRVTEQESVVENPVSKTTEPRASETETKVDKKEQKKQAFSTRSFNSENLNSQSKDNLDKLGLNYDVENQNVAQDNAEKIIKELGIVEAYNLAKQGLVRGGARTWIMAQMFEEINKQIFKETNENNVELAEYLADELSLIMKNFANEKTLTGQEISMLNRVYQKFDIKYDLNFARENWEKRFSEKIPAEIEAKFKKLEKDLKILEKEKQILEDKIGTLEEQEAINNLKNDIIKANSKKISQSSLKRAADALRKTKFTKSISDLSNLQSDPLGVIKGVFDGAIETIAKSLDAGSTIEQAIKKGLIEIKKSEWYKSLSDKNKTEAEKIAKRDFNAFFEKQKTNIDDSNIEQGAIKIPSDLLYDLVSKGINNIKSLTDAVHEVLSKDYSELTHREVRDAITGYGKQITETQDNIKKEISRLKTDGKQMSALEDLAEGNRPKRSGRSPKEYTAEQRNKIKQIRELLKKLPIDDSIDQKKYYKDALESYKSRIKNRIKDLTDALDNNEKIINEKRNTQVDDEAKSLISKRDSLQKEYDDTFGKPIKSEKTLIEEIIRRKEKSLHDLEVKLAYAREEGKELPKKEQRTITDPKIDILNKQIEESRTELNDTLEQVGIAESKRLERGISYAKRRLFELDEKLRNRDFTKKTPKKYAYNKELIELKKKILIAKTKWDIEFEKQEFKNLGYGEKLLEYVYRAFGTIKGIKATADLSAMLRQGIVLGSRNPKEFTKATVNMHKFAFDSKAYKDWMTELESSEDYINMVEDGLSITDTSGDVLRSEERFVGNLLSKKIKVNGVDVNIVGRITDGSERAYGGFLNSLRVSVYRKLATQYESMGITRQEHPKKFKNIAKFVNNATGRGVITSDKRIAKVLNIIFFSPRMITGMAGVFKDMVRSDSTPYLRRQAATSLVTFMGYQFAMKMLIGTALGLIGGDDDEKVTMDMNPVSTDFNKVRKGDKRYDVSGGYGIATRTIARVLSNQTASSIDSENKSFDDIYGKTRFSEIPSFFLNKLSPLASQIYKYGTGEHPLDFTKKKEDATVMDYINALITPISLLDFIENIQNMTPEGQIFLDLFLNTYGVGVQSYGSSSGGNNKKGIVGPKPPKPPSP